MTAKKKPKSQVAIDREFAESARIAVKQHHSKICLPLLDNLGDNILEVGYNGRMYLIKRGSKVMVPNALLEILTNANVPYQRIAH